MSLPGDPSARLLVLAPTGCDAELIARTLGPLCEVVVCPRPEDLLPELAAGAGALLIAEEAITPALLRDLVEGLHRQEPWSDVPIVVLSGKASSRHLPDWASRDVLSPLEPVGNVTVLERPVRIQTLQGVVKVALESRKRQQQMRMLHESVQALNRGKDEFLAMLGHELRNPLSAIRTAVAVLQQGGADEARIRRYVELLDRQSLSMKRMLDDLLDVSRVSLGKVRLELGPVQLGELVQATVESLQPAARALGHTLTLNGNVGRLPIRGDPVRLEQIVNNVVGNALKYTPRGGRIDVTLERHGSDAVIEVKDDGIGLEPEMLSRVFELFTQGRVGLDRAQGGLGVGLALVDSLVKMHGGRVTAQSDGLGKGSAFRIELPLSSAGASADPKTIGRASGADRLKVMLVDDDPDLREALQELLAAQGHEVAVAADGLQGVELAKSLRPDVVLVDIGLPGINGFEVARRLRQVCSPELHLVALTGYGTPDDRRQSHEAG